MATTSETSARGRESSKLKKGMFGRFRDDVFLPAEEAVIDNMSLHPMAAIGFGSLFVVAVLALIMVSVRGRGGRGYRGSAMDFPSQMMKMVGF
jgi:hypothetical protein